MTSELDPRAARALHIISTVRGLLERYERILRLPNALRLANLDAPLRAVTVAQHALATTWNVSLASVPEHLPEPPTPPAPPSAPFGPTSGKPSVAEGAPEVNRWAERMAAD